MVPAATSISTPTSNAISFPLPVGFISILAMWRPSWASPGEQRPRHAVLEAKSGRYRPSAMRGGKDVPASPHGPRATERTFLGRGLRASGSGVGQVLEAPAAGGDGGVGGVE